MDVLMLSEELSKRKKTPPFRLKPVKEFEVKIHYIMFTNS